MRLTTRTLNTRTLKARTLTTRRQTNGSPFDTMRTLWTEHREASLNWLALGLLLAAWNVTSDDAAPAVERRPPELRGYAAVSVRAVQRVVARRS